MRSRHKPDRHFDPLLIPNPLAFSTYHTSPPPFSPGAVCARAALPVSGLRLVSEGQEGEPLSHHQRHHLPVQRRHQPGHHLPALPVRLLLRQPRLPTPGGVRPRPEGPGDREVDQGRAGEDADAGLRGDWV